MSNPETIQDKQGSALKRVLIFSLAYYPYPPGGAEVAVKELTDRLSSESFQFDMVTLRFDRAHPHTERIGGVNIYRVGSGSGSKLQKYLFPFRVARLARRLHRKNPYDLVWSIMANYAGFAASFFKKKFPSVPFLLTLQEGDPISYIKRRVWLVYPLFKKIFKRADFVQAISNYLANFAKEMGATAPIVVVPNGVDLARFRDVSPDRVATIRAGLGKKAGDIFLVTSSRLVPKNGITDIIESLQFLPQNVSLLVLGSGPLRAELELNAKRLTLNARVKFLGFILHTELPFFLHASDIFIRPSLSEGMGNSFIEAMAAGVPIIATNVGGIPDFLTDRETGLFCAVHNPKDIAEQVQTLLRDPALRASITANAQNLVTEKYDWNFLAQRTKDEVFSKLFMN